MTENDVKATVIDYLRRTGWLVLRVNSGAFGGEYTDLRGNTRKRFMNFVTWYILGCEPQTSGVADIIALKDGRVIAVETKAPTRKGNVSQAQQDFLAEWGQHGGQWCVVSDLDDLLMTLRI